MKVNFKNVGRKLRLPEEKVLSLLNATMTLQLLESITQNDIIKTLRGKRDYAISEINVSSVKGKAFFRPTIRRKINNFI